LDGSTIVGKRLGTMGIVEIGYSDGVRPGADSGVVRLDVQRGAVASVPGVGQPEDGLERKT
jgi:hypothetical protein